MASQTLETPAQPFQPAPKYLHDFERIDPGPARAPIALGAAEIRHVPEIAYKMPTALMTADSSLIDLNASWLKPHWVDAQNRWDMVVQSFIVIVDGKVVLLDPCTGNGRDSPNLPIQHMLDTPYLERFAATGIRPEDVDYVFCTHLHGDHCGWNTQLRNGRFVPTFPNARYVIVRREFDRWDTRRPDHNHVPANAGVFENSVLPVVEAGLAELVEDSHRLSASLQIEPAHGHTVGHSMLALDSGSASALFVGDSFHHPLEIKYPEIGVSSSENPAAAVRTRKAILHRCAHNNTLFIPAHFTAPHLGWIRATDGAYAFEAYD